MNYYLYKIENKQNHKKYIGLTNNIKRRRLRHFADLKSGRHDNSFLQKEFIKYGEENFSFEEILNGDYTDKEIGKLEKEYIKKYDSYLNGYNQNEGGNFGASNGGTHLILSDLLNILSVLEFMTRPGQVLGEMYEVSRTTISRIKKGNNHQRAIEVYKSLSDEQRKSIYNNFLETTDFYEKKVNSTITQSKRQLTEQQIYMILYNHEYKIITKKKMAEKVGVKSTHTLDCIIQGKTYKDFVLKYNQLNNEEKQQIASLLSNEQK